MHRIVLSGLVFGLSASAWAIAPSDRLVAGAESDDVQRFTAGGAFVEEFIATNLGGLDLAIDMDLGPDGTLYITSLRNDKILKYDGTTGAFISEFVFRHADRADGCH